MKFKVLFLALFFFSATSSLSAKPRQYTPEIYTFALPDLPSGEIAFVNGMNHRPDRAVRCALLLAKKAGGYNVYTVYNPTDGLIGDLRKCYVELFHFKCTPPVNKLHEKWDQFFSRAPDGDIFLQFCHSQGAIQVRNALLTYPEHFRKRIQVVAIAPGAYISDDICYRAYHYISRRDLVPYVDQSGKKNCQKTTIMLTPHCKSCFLDHHFLSQTYREAIEHHLKEYVDAHTHHK